MKFSFHLAELCLHKLNSLLLWHLVYFRYRYENDWHILSVQLFGAFWVAFLNLRKIRTISTEFIDFWRLKDMKKLIEWRRLNRAMKGVLCGYPQIVAHESEKDLFSGHLVYFRYRYENDWHISSAQLFGTFWVAFLNVRKIKTISTEFIDFWRLKDMKKLTEWRRLNRAMKGVLCGYPQIVAHESEKDLFSGQKTSNWLSPADSTLNEQTEVCGWVHILININLQSSFKKQTLTYKYHALQSISDIKSHLKKPLFYRLSNDRWSTSGNWLLLKDHLPVHLIQSVQPLKISY